MFRNTSISIFCMSMMLIAASAMSATITVDKAGGADFDNIADAVASALANNEADEIIVSSGLYINSSNVGETLNFIGDDDITLRGDPDDRPVVVIEPDIEQFPESSDGLYIQMSGRLSIENFIFVPSETFFFESTTDDMIAVVDAGAGSALDLTLKNVVITQSTLDNTPITTTGFDDPRFIDNTFSDDGINVDSTASPDAVINLLLDNVIVTGYGTEADSDGLVLDGEGINCTITNGSKFTYIRRRGIFNFTANSLTIEGTDENPILIWGGGETMIRSSSGVNNWSHLWCVGMQDGDGDGAINTNFAARVDPNGGASLTASNCIFAFTNNDGIFMNFDATEPLTYEINQCTFYNVPALVRFGFVGEPGPSENVTMTITDSIVDNGDWVANNDGTFFAPETTVVDYGDGDNTLAQVSITNLGHRSETLVSSRSGSSAPTMDGNIIEVGDYEFLSTEFDPQTMSDFLVVSNCELLGSAASGGNPLGGARPADCPINAIEQWSIH